MESETTFKGDTVDKVIRFESGDMSKEEVIEFFQGMIDSGLVWQLQGSYGRLAENLISNGYCTPKED